MGQACHGGVWVDRGGSLRMCLDVVRDPSPSVGGVWERLCCRTRVLIGCVATICGVVVTISTCRIRSVVGRHILAM